MCTALSVSVTAGITHDKTPTARLLHPKLLGWKQHAQPEGQLHDTAQSKSTLQHGMSLLACTRSMSWEHVFSSVFTATVFTTDIKACRL